MVDIPRLPLSHPWLPIAIKLGRGEQLRKADVNELLAKFPDAPRWVSAAIDEHEREKKWVRGRRPIGGCKWLIRVDRVDTLNAEFLPEEEAKERTKRGTPTERVVLRVATRLGLSTDSVRDIIYRNSREHNRSRAKTPSSI
jgi:hypothetical protein